MLLFGILFIGIVLFPTSSQAETIFFDFSDGLGSCFSFYNPTGLFTLDDTSGELRLVKPEDTMKDIIKSGKICSNFLIGGDFDISVDYKLNIPLQDGDQLEFHLCSKNFSYFIVRSNESWLGGDNYHVWFNDHAEPIPAITTTDTSGTLRFVRIGDEISAYFMSEGSSEYTRIHSQVFDSGYVRIRMVLQNQPHSHSALDASFDNLRIEADQISCCLDIKVNGSDGPITLYNGDDLNLSVSINPNGHEGEPADYFLWVKVPNGGIYSYVLGCGWIYSAIPIVGYQNDLLNLSDYPVYSTTIGPWLARGGYTFHFAVDLEQKGMLDAEHFGDTAVVYIP